MSDNKEFEEIREVETVEVIDDRAREEEAESLCRWAAAAPELLWLPRW